MMKQKIKEELMNLADSKYKEFYSRLCPGIHNILGVRVPKLRNYAKKLAKECEIEKLLKEIDNQYYEEIMLQGMLIGLEKEKFAILQKHIETFLPKIDNWAVCDVFCAGLKVTKKYKEEMWNLLRKALKSNQEFKIRFGIVMILNYYIEEDYLEKDFNLFNTVSMNQAYYVQMAIAWAISICFVKFYDKTITYIKTAPLDKFTYHKALQKAIESYRLTNQQKEFLKSIKNKTGK